MLCRARLLALVLIVATAVGACAGERGRAEDAPAGDPEPSAEQQALTAAGHEGANGRAVGTGLRAAAPVYPLAWVAAQVAPAADSALLTSQGQDPHDLELGARDRELLETADVVAYMGDLDYQPQVEEAVAATDAHVVSFTEVVGPDHLLTWDDDDHGGHDPHAWFDAGLMAAVTTEVGEAFADADPGHGQAYRDNAAALADRLATLDDEIEAMFAGGCAHDRMIVSHEAYAYLVEPHGLGQEGISGADGHGEASPRRIAELVEQIQDDGIEHVLTEPTEGRQDAEAVAAEADVALLEVHSLEVVDDEHAFEAGFLELLRDQAETAATALSCD